MIVKLFHDQDWCEHVTIEDICGSLDDLIGSPIIRATQDSNRDNPKKDGDDSHTWTFYNIATAKGHVTIRWYGSSNGYYSEGVDFIALCYGCDEEMYGNEAFCSECGEKVAKYIPVEQKIKYWKEKYEK